MAPAVCAQLPEKSLTPYMYTLLDVGLKCPTKVSSSLTWTAGPPELQDGAEVDERLVLRRVDVHLLGKRCV